MDRDAEFQVHLKKVCKYHESVGSILDLLESNGFENEWKFILIEGLRREFDIIAQMRKDEFIDPKNPGTTQAMDMAIFQIHRKLSKFEAYLMELGRNETKRIPYFIWAHSDLDQSSQAQVAVTLSFCISQLIKYHASQREGSFGFESVNSACFPQFRKVFDEQFAILNKVLFAENYEKVKDDIKKLESTKEKLSKAYQKFYKDFPEYIKGIFEVEVESAKSLCGKVQGEIPTAWMNYGAAITKLQLERIVQYCIDAESEPLSEFVYETQVVYSSMVLLNDHFFRLKKTHPLIYNFDCGSLPKDEYNSIKERLLKIFEVVVKLQKRIAKAAQSDKLPMIDTAFAIHDEFCRVQLAKDMEGVRKALEIAEDCLQRNQL